MIDDDGNRMATFYDFPELREEHEDHERGREPVRFDTVPHLPRDVFERRKFEDGEAISTQQRKAAA